MQSWADNCPENFQHKLLLIQAEEARLTGDSFAAMTLYKQAAHVAKEHDFPHLKAMIHELTAKFYADHDFEEFARLHFMKAHGNYTMWGATRKIEHLSEKYAKFFAAQARQLPRAGTHDTTRRTSTEILYFFTPASKRRA